MRENQRFEVGVKAFIERAGKILVVHERPIDFWDIPGGRIQVGEEYAPLATILGRELKEELGSRFKVQIGPLIAVWTKRNRRTGGPILLLGFTAAWLEGEIKPGEEVGEYRWMTRQETLRLHTREVPTKIFRAFWESRK